MNAERLLALYERVAEAPDAIARLRRFILDLAVRGKLVPQDPQDEPASELLKRIAKEKARLVKAGEIKREKPLESPNAGDLKIGLPFGWSIASLSEVTVCLDYRRVPINGTEREARIAGKSQEVLFPYYGATQQQGWIDDYLFDGEFILLGEDGVPFHDPLRPKAYLIAGKSWVNNHAHVFHGVFTSPRFLVHYLNVFDYAGRVVGATRAKLNQAQALTIPVPLPPLAEQHRIVAKVDELMALCDQLEAARQEREARRDRLAAASLARLNAPDPETFQSDARFTLNALPALTTRPNQIKQLRQTILNLAVRGKLVPQDPSDESVHLDVLSETEAKVALPASWRYIRLAELLREDTRNGYSRRPDDAPEGAPILRISAGTVRRDGVVAEEEHKLISGIDAKTRKEYGLRAGDLLACRFNGNKAFVGRLSIFNDYLRIQPIYPDKLIRVRLEPQCAVSAFLRLASETDLVRDDVEVFCATTVGNWGISASNLKEVRFPVPPLGEQRRIVAKVDELMALCDRLEASLTTSNQTRTRLLEATLAEALTPTRVSEMEVV
jgi:type I restriction enzyme S subunit